MPQGLYTSISFKDSVCAWRFMFFYKVLTPIYAASGLCSTGNTRKYQQIDVYIYQCVVGA